MFKYSKNLDVIKSVISNDLKEIVKGNFNRVLKNN